MVGVLISVVVYDLVVVVVVVVVVAICEWSARLSMATATPKDWSWL